MVMATHQDGRFFFFFVVSKGDALCSKKGHRRHLLNPKCTASAQDRQGAIVFYLNRKIGDRVFHFLRGGLKEEKNKLLLPLSIRELMTY